jgi:hypothetical protein
MPVCNVPSLVRLSMDRMYNNCDVRMVMMGQTIALQTPLSTQVVKNFFIKSPVVADLRNEIRQYLKLRKLRVVNTRGLNWNPND